MFMQRIFMWILTFLPCICRFNSFISQTKKEKPVFSIRVADIQGVEEMDQEAFKVSFCFQVSNTNRLNCIRVILPSNC